MLWRDGLGWGWPVHLWWRGDVMEGGRCVMCGRVVRHVAVHRDVGGHVVHVHVRERLGCIDWCRHRGGHTGRRRSRRMRGRWFPTRVPIAPLTLLDSCSIVFLFFLLNTLLFFIFLEASVHERFTALGCRVRMSCIPGSCYNVRWMNQAILLV
uniref:Uncharacterized protein n=3 Tax=Cacopsylla melanoneura TaxID=428564 RepID=A0A8D8LAK2_9HEMI